MCLLTKFLYKKHKQKVWRVVNQRYSTVDNYIFKN